ncbi:hypothetical protein ABOM_008666 [Aspergillus bombycis]|uniref:Class II aldolase/adducin N-terminal domain-containing protein n=1 Tax=Aspergillus bombycis TaxID=109264 RepID=A0A1F7ZUX4_9EURO|nr:hypothetical protein ABOM_008666 [Aspergillus bombycis]OGM43273.1 hypothetical protein ABOM_008666 [Aspergillus bombycis]
MVPAKTETLDMARKTKPDALKEEKKTPLQLISQGACLPGIPRHPTFTAHRQWLLEQMALAFRVFARKDYTDGMAGHISVRDPENPHTFWTNPLAVHFAVLKASDMILVNYEGMPIGGNMSRPANAAGFLIHSAVHKARPDVNVACHTHSPHGMAWSAFGRPLEMLTQDAAYLYGDAQAVYQDFGGVVLTEEEGNRIGAALGPKGKGMILQNHGLLTVGSTVSEACFLMTLMERACQCQLLAEAAAANGLQKILIPDESARYTFENSSDPETLYWEGQPDLEFEEYMSKGEHRR